MSDKSNLQNPLLDEVLGHYERGLEAERLSKRTNPIELVRTQELLSRYLPPPPAVIFDVGGGSGIYACWLAQLGYKVHLIDAVPLHVEQARSASQVQPDYPLASAEVGDARQLNQANNSVDAVLLFGPLYHLIERSDRKINCFVANWEGNLIASCILVIVPNLTRGACPYGLIENVITHPDYRRQGVGKCLIHHGLQSAWSHNCYKVILLSGSQTKEVLQFYEKTGFKKGIKTGFVATPISH